MPTKFETHFRVEVEVTTEDWHPFYHTRDLGFAHSAIRNGNSDRLYRIIEVKEREIKRANGEVM